MSTMSSNSTTTKKGQRRTWRYDEDEKLIQFLKEMCQDGKWKAEGGFKAGYLLHLEKLFAEAMPDSEFKSTNIDSRLGYLKKRFNALLEIKEKGSGFGWNEEQKMVTGDRKLFDEWAKSHKDAAGLYMKSFPLFDDLEYIFAKDRAVGANAATAADRVELDMSHDSILEAIQENARMINEDDENDEDVHTVSAQASETMGKRKRSSASAGSSKKSRANKEVESAYSIIRETMKQISTDNKEQFKELMNMLNRSPGSYKDGLYEELLAVHGISRMEVMKLMKKMNQEDVCNFRRFKDEDEKYDYLRMLLDEF